MMIKMMISIVFHTSRQLAHAMDPRARSKAQRVYKAKQASLASQGRCPRCWFSTPKVCICSRIHKVKFASNVRFVVYQHYLEFGNAGDDAKLLWICAPDKTLHVIHGVNDEILRTVVNGNDHRCLMLFPDDSSITLEEFLARKAEHSETGRLSTENESPLLVIVVDATWRRARKMVKYFKRNINPRIPTIRLHPTTASIYSRTQTEPGRICSIEATALLLQEYGENQTLCNDLVSFVKVNNAALSGKLVNKEMVLWGVRGGHPAWYYGRRLTEAGHRKRTQSARSTSDHNLVKKRRV